uniref:SWIM-type domain-containing protein n=1 Tax=Lactuca sativa TaxID=4236 RepID=A0A9R1XJA2_LACSA|nr:hypothetical protein LSAT_V11C400181260 [Lactuca sativa]
MLMRKSIETSYGTWESNFDEFPKYITALQASNPDTVVKWFHKPNDSSNVATFKYIFWAFGPDIDAFRLCGPVIFVDGCHMKGSYKGKLLVVVTKDANNNILHVAYVVVDEDSSHSWCWFLYQLRHFVAQDRKLCVISNRHQGIINAIENLQEWEEPLAYHRFCLRHIRSNFMKRYKNFSLKKLCWTIGSTTLKRKFVTNMREWCLLYDENRRWGILTTNISESMNNALRGARHLSIRACIDLTFNKTVQLFRKHSNVAMNCNIPLPSCMWHLFCNWDTRAQNHNLTKRLQNCYKVMDKWHRRKYEFVHYFQQTCTCGKWQIERLSCSHALSVFLYKGDNPLSIVNNVYQSISKASYF